MNLCFLKLFKDQKICPYEHPRATEMLSRRFYHYTPDPFSSNLKDIRSTAKQVPQCKWYQNDI